MKRIVRNLFGAVVLLSSATNAFSQSSSINVVTSAVPFLRISPDARAGGMGDLGVATSQIGRAHV